MSLSKTEQEFIQVNKDLIEAILAKKEELKDRIEGLANNLTIRQYKDPAKQEAYLIGLQNKKLARARMISRIIKKLDSKEAYAAMNLNPGNVYEEIEDADTAYDEDSDDVQTVRLDKKTVQKLAKEVKKGRGGATITYR